MAAATPEQVQAAIDALVPSHYELPKRPGFGKLGKNCPLNVNAYAVTKFPSCNIYQYDCQLGDDNSARSLIEKLWNHHTVQRALNIGTVAPANAVLFDGARLAWSPRLLKLPQGDALNMMVDLDDGRPLGKYQKPNRHRVIVKLASKIPMHLLQGYLEQTTSWDPKILSCLTFIDHLLREGPSHRHLAIKRSFFDSTVRSSLGVGVEAWKGIFQSARLANSGQLGRGRMIVNVDVATAVFWSEGTLMDLAAAVLKMQPIDVRRELTDKNKNAKLFKELRRLKKIRFFCKHRKSDQCPKPKSYSVEGFTSENAIQTRFERKNYVNGVEQGSTICTVQEYFLEVYDVRLRYPELPLIRTRKKAEVFPIELCYIEKGQRYPYKLNDTQTADMIKFTVTKPQVRLNNIRANTATLDWAKDPWLRAYNMGIDTKMIMTNARILPTPTLVYGKGSQKVKVVPEGGRWDLRGQKFTNPAPEGLACWGIMVFSTPRIVPEEQVKQFVRTFVQVYTGHGGKVTEKDPPIMYADLKQNIAINLYQLYKKTGHKINMKPQLLMCILSQKCAYPYNDIKSYTDVNIGVPSQCLQYRHVLANKPQYASNVCMKVNAKIGGHTVSLDTKDHPLCGKGSTLYIGADVSHSAPGHTTTSYASMVGSTDREGNRFCAIANTNGSRVEVITTKNVMNFVCHLLRMYRMSTNLIPDRIYYFRDGVSEGQYQEVLSSEVCDIEAACSSLQPGYKPKITVVVCSKRHHFRFFPQDKHLSDRNANPLPGTIVEKDITHPDQYDFYLASHNAIQGTSRPVHYHVIRDDNKMPVDLFQSLVYNMCYVYMRATNSVSLIPATYYAHLASARARCHEPINEIGWTNTPPARDPRDPNRDSRDHAPNHELKPMHKHMKAKMWFI